MGVCLTIITRVNTHIVHITAKVPLITLFCTLQILLLDIFLNMTFENSMNFPIMQHSLSVFIPKYQTEILLKKQIALIVK